MGHRLGSGGLGRLNLGGAFSVQRATVVKQHHRGVPALLQFLVDGAILIANPNATRFASPAPAFTRQFLFLIGLSRERTVLILKQALRFRPGSLRELLVRAGWHSVCAFAAHRRAGQSRQAGRSLKARLRLVQPAPALLTIQTSEPGLPRGLAFLQYWSGRDHDLPPTCQFVPWSGIKSTIPTPRKSSGP